MIEFHVRENHARAEVGVMTKNGIADVIEVWHLHVVEEDAIFKFARVPHHCAFAGDHVLAHVTAAADPTIFTDPRGALQKRTLLDDRAFTNEHMVTDERLAHQLSQDRWLQAKLQITRNLFQRVPDVILVLEQFRMSGVFEVEIISGREHFQCSRWRIECAVASAFFWVARARLACLVFGVAPRRTLS